MPLPGSQREKRMLQEIVEPDVQIPQEPEFLQEINEPTHEEILVEEKPKRRSRRKSKG